MRTDILPPDELDLLMRWVPSRADQAGFYSGLDNKTGTVRVMGAGIWRAQDAERYHEEQGRIVEAARRRFGALKVSFDVRGWVVENPQSASQFQDINAQIYRAEDRLTAIVHSSLYKRYPRTALSVGQCEVFVSVSAAETWLQAYSEI